MTTYSDIEYRSSNGASFLHSHEDRQIGVLLFIILWAVVIPAVTLLGLLMPTAWMAVLGLHPHAALWGWLSDRRRAANGTTVWSIASWIPLYYITLVSTWITYYFGELLGLGFRAFRKVLTA